MSNHTQTAQDNTRPSRPVGRGGPDRAWTALLAAFRRNQPKRGRYRSGRHIRTDVTTPRPADAT
ncbi:hypothetical protein, partial [Phytoactinopolyspora endophytica]|uniref:hypothetical protein n=1 Tax=Phytoactinopolyspora endophytica TaxID=1642495 RepID=UPI0013ECA9A7